MTKVEGLSELSNNLKKLAQQSRQNDDVTVLVGYAGQINGEPSYAIYVHENLEMKLRGKPRPSGIGVYWGPHGQSKFLEATFRQMQNELYGLVATAVKKGATMLQGLLIAGYRLQRESQKLVPVEYGNLKASAFTEQEK